LAFAQIRLGVELLPQGPDHRIDRAIAEAWARIVARGRARPSVLDAFLAATALVHGMTLVTRRGSDLADLEVPVLKPWHT
jgi:predicted nucleic acid-binding protein